MNTRGIILAAGAGPQHPVAWLMPDTVALPQPSARSALEITDVLQTPSTPGQWFGTALKAGNGTHLWTAPGMAHEFFGNVETFA